MVSSHLLCLFLDCLVFLEAFRVVHYQALKIQLQMMFGSILTQTEYLFDYYY